MNHTASMTNEGRVASYGPLQLVHPSNPVAGHWCLSSDGLIVGRECHCDIVVDDCTVSRRHAYLQVLGHDRVRVVDLGSRNGTRINNRRLEHEGVLQVGDRVTFGVVTFVLQGAVQDDRRSLPAISVEAEPDDELRGVVESVPANRPLTRPAFPDGSAARAFVALSELTVDDHDLLEGVCRKVLKLLSRILKGERYAIFLPATEPGAVDLLAHYQIAVAASVPSMTSRAIIREVMVKRRALHYREGAGGRQFTGSKAVSLQRVRSIMVVPLICEARVSGMLYADTTQRKQRYNEGALTLLIECGRLCSSKIVEWEDATSGAHA